MGQPTSIRSTTLDPLLTYKFIVSWGPSTGTPTVVAGVSKVSALSRTTAPVKWREGGSPEHTRQIPGQTTYDDITLEKGIILDVSFEQWANKMWFYEQTAKLGEEVSLADFRKTLRIDHCNQAGQIVDTYYVFNCWPTKYTALPDLNAQDDAQVAIETLVLVNEGWARDDTVNAPKLPSFDLPASPIIAPA